jgi:hypothetical protein
MSPRFYLPTIPLEVETGPTSWEKIAANPEIALIITEGELKAACACKHGFPTVSIGGVYAFRSRKHKKPLIDDFYLFEWEGRPVTLLFDSDLSTNQHVQQALYSLAKELSNLGAEVFIGFLPDVVEEGKTGLDDYLLSQGPEELAETVLAEAEAFTENKTLWELNREVAYVDELETIVRLGSGQLIKPGNFAAHAYSHWRYKIYTEDKLIEKSAPAQWLKWPARHTLDNLTYVPAQPRIIDNRLYNLWQGWGCEAKKGSLAPWRKLMRAFFGSHDRERQWFERWLAHQVQHPGVKLATAVLMWGVAQGTGKSFVGYVMRDILGRPNFSEISNHELMQDANFNFWQARKQLILVDEVRDVSGHYKQVNERLKQLITQEEIIVNLKYQPNYVLTDVANYYLTSNSPNALPLDDNDRRYFIWEVQESLGEDWFINTFDPWAKGEGPSALRYYLQELPLGRFTAKTKAPMTEAKAEMIYTSKTDLSIWVHELAKDPITKLKHVEADLLTNTQLFALFTDGEPTRTSQTAMGRELKKAGLIKRYIKVGEKTEGLYVVRNRAYWVTRTATQWANHYLKYFPDVDGGTPPERGARKLGAAKTKTKRKYT